MFATPLRERVGNTVISNGLRTMMQKQLATISLLADKSPWTPEQFAEARTVVETQFPTAAALWARLGGEEGATAGNDYRMSEPPKSQ